MTRLPDDLSVLVRGWLHGNVTFIAGPRPACVDSGYHSGFDALRAAFEAFGGPVTDLAEIALTHVHSDHSGGVADLVAASGARVSGHPDAKDLVDRWDVDGLWLGPTGQVLPRFAMDRAIVEGDEIQLGARTWRVLWTPGHATGGVAFFDPSDGVLITGDALWEDGFGLLDPWADGPDVFDLAARALETLSALDAQVVIPGHGQPFSDLAGALARARSRLAHLRQNPERLRRQVVRNGVMFYGLAHPDATPADLLERLQIMARVHPPTAPDAPSTEALVAGLIAEVRR